MGQSKFIQNVHGKNVTNLNLFWTNLIFTTLLENLNKLDNIILGKPYFALAKSASATDFHLRRNCMLEFLLSYPTRIAVRKVREKMNVDVSK